MPYNRAHDVAVGVTNHIRPYNIAIGFTNYI
jgi:hypothetical protein